MSKWKKINDPPCTPFGVMFFSGNAKLTDQNGKEHPPDPIRDFRLSLGYWDGKYFRFKDTGHIIDDDYRHYPDWVPTHYRILSIVPDP